jgi:hypothetical protein
MKPMHASSRSCHLVFPLIFHPSKLEAIDYYFFCNKLFVLIGSINDFLGLSRKKETILPPFNPQIKILRRATHRNRSIRNRISANSFLLTATPVT